MKAKTLLIAAAMFLALSAAAFAQATFQVGSTPVTAVIKTGNTELVGDVTLTLQSGNFATGTFTITYPGQVTNAFVKVCSPNTTPAFLCATLDTFSVPVASITLGTAPNQTVLSITQNAPAGQVTVAAVSTGTGAGNGVLNGAAFTVTGVRIQISGTALTPPLYANISAVGNFIVAGQTNAVVVNGIADGIKTVTGAAYTLNGTTLAQVGTTTAYLDITEGFNYAFGPSPTGDMTTGLGLRITLSGAPPAGVTISFPLTGNTYDANSVTSGGSAPLFGATITPGVFVAANSDWTSATTGAVIKSDSTSLSAYYKVATSTSSTLTEFVYLPITVSTKSSAATLPLAAASFSVTVSLAPIEPATGSGAVNIPRFTVLESSAVTILNIIGNTTGLLIPYATVGSGYDTGIAISNSSADPGKTPLGTVKAGTPNAGLITFYLYQQQVGTTAPKSYTYTTGAASPGTGLDATGILPAGSTYTVLLSQLLGAIPSGPTTFTGYIFASCGFTNAHGQYVLSNFTTFSQGALMLVVGNGSDRTAAGENLNN
jgi:hypothetical protein